jgi:hypothetical protein
MRVEEPVGGVVGVGSAPGVGVAAGEGRIAGWVGADLSSPQAAARSTRAAVTARSNERLMAYLQKETGKSVLHRERHADGLPSRHRV